MSSLGGRSSHRRHQAGVKDKHRYYPRRNTGEVATAKPPVPAWRWGLWFSLMGLALVVFYVLLTPLWLGLRALAWLADRRSRLG